MNLLQQKLGRLEQVFLALLLADLALYFVPAAAGIGAIVTLAVYITGAIVIVRIIRKNLKQIIWRLRNRLIVSYLFIAVVPIALLMLLVGIGGYILMGQMAIYVVNTELDRLSAGRSGTALSPELLSNVAPNLGDVLFAEWSSGSNPDLSFRNLRRGHVPPPANPLDIELTWLSPITFQSQTYALVVRSRPSAVLGTIFGQRMEWGQNILIFAIGVACLFLIVQLGSIIVGVSLTRTITGAVHELYEGTQKVKEGGLSHRIAVRGTDQLAELSLEFNRMTENLQRLIVVEKERERLQSELEIARDVQSRLFPKAALSFESLLVGGVCHPAQQVSGDYYDFLRLEDSSIAIAIGDVAGKGISAALLMATIQSAMRSQLTRTGPKSPAQVVSLLNRQIYASTAPEKYATFYFGLYDEATGLLTYTNAGHLPPILLRAGETQKLDITGTVVGAFPFSQYEEKQISLRTGDLLLAYTDGITEPENAYGEMFGEDRLIDVLIKHQSAGSDEIIARAMEAVLEWTGSPELQDDMTMLIASRNGT
jgi:sigma-B regulation protein RsbU (phosphoserine phosphatase)